MADTKISGLPASTTPLAGTEVLPIVQSSATKQVSVANLTAGRDVSANTFSSAAGAVATPSITTAGDANTGFWFPAADTVAVSTAGTERMRIDSTGAVGIGTTALGASYGLRVSKTFAGDNGGNIFSSATGTASTPTGVYSFRSTIFTGANGGTPYTISSLYGYSAAQSTFSADSTVTNQYGFLAASSLTGATNNYGFYGAIASGTNRWNFYAAGTAANVFVGTTSIGGIVGSESLRVTPVASAVNFLEINGAIAASKPFLYANGSDASVSMNLVAKGAGSYTFLTSTGTATQFVVAHTASAVNYLQVTGAPTGGVPYFLATGSDTNVDSGYLTKGSGFHRFWTNSVGNEQFRITHTASAVNYLQATGSATGAATSLSAQGSDTNIDLALTPKGTGVLAFGTYTAGIIAQAGYITIKDAGGTTRRLLVG